MAEERIDIIITEKGSRVVKRNIESIGNTAGTASRGVDLLKRTLATLGVALSVNELKNFLDLNTNLQNRLRATGLEGRKLTAVYDELLKRANTTNSSFEGSVELFSRLAVSTKDLGTSQQELIEFTDSLNQAIRLSGASAVEAEAGLIQLSQGMASGTLRGDELRSVLEQLPAVADVIAQHLGVTRGELRQMGADGKITAEIILEAFKGAREEIAERFGATVPTIGQALQRLRNNAIDMAGSLNEATGIADIAAKGLLILADNLDVVLKAALGASSGLLLIGGASGAINLATNAVRALTVAIAANPVGFLVVALTSAISTLALFRNEINLGVDEVTTLGDFIAVLGPTITNVFSSILEGARQTFGPLIDMVTEWADTLDLSVAGVLRATARQVDVFIGLWRGTFNAVITLFKQLPSAVTGNGGFAELSRAVSDSFNEGVARSNQATAFVDNLVDAAKERAAARIAAEAGSVPVDLTQAGPRRISTTEDAEALKKAQEETDRLRDSVFGLIASYDSVFDAQMEYNRALELLNEGERAGFISAQDRERVLGLVVDRLRDSFDPLAAVNRELDREAELLQLTGEARRVGFQMMNIEQDLRRRGVALTQEELTGLRERLTLMEQEARVAQIRNQVLEASVGPQRSFNEMITATQQLLQAGDISREQANNFLVQSNQELLAGTVEAQEALVTQYENTYQRIDALRQADLISEQTSAQLKQRADVQLAEARLSNARSFFGTLSNLSRSENKKLAAIGKAAAIAQATIDGILAIQKALSSAPPPASYALAAATAAVQGANIGQIIATTPGFAFGGDFTVGGNGGTDSQMVSFRATPGEKVSVRTPTQEREESRREGGGEGAPGAGSSVRVINVIDPNLMQDYLTSAAGEKTLVNVIQRNAGTVRQVLEG